MSNELYEIKMPKRFNHYDYTIKIDWDRNTANCDPTVAYKPILYLYPEKETVLLDTGIPDRSDEDREYQLSA